MIYPSCKFLFFADWAAVVPTAKSLHHCTLEKSMEDGAKTIVNMADNVTFVNGERLLVKRPIAHGSVVALCSTKSEASFRFHNYQPTTFSDNNFVLNTFNRFVSGTSVHSITFLHHRSNGSIPPCLCCWCFFLSRPVVTCWCGGSHCVSFIASVQASDAQCGWGPKRKLNRR